MATRQLMGWFVILTMIFPALDILIPGSLTPQAMAQEVERDCGHGERLEPTYNPSPWWPNQEYDANAEPFDVMCLPEAWAFMAHRWQAISTPIPNWPFAVIIDDGFFHFSDSKIRPELYPGFPDGSLNYPYGTALGGTSIFNQTYGLHGTRVLSLLASRGNNAKGMVGVAAPWENIANGFDWGPSYLPVRLGRGGPIGNEVDYLVQAFDDVVLNFHEARVVNLSKDLAAISQSKAAELERRLDEANWRQTVVVVAAGNNRRKIPGNHWLRSHPNVILVGALDHRGEDLWIDGVDGSATGAIDLYAPGADIRVIDPKVGALTDSGTSYAAPMVTGVVAMMQNLQPALDAAAARSILAESSDKIVLPSTGESVLRLNAYKAVTCAESFSAANYAPGHYQWWCSLGTGGWIHGTYSIF